MINLPSIKPEFRRLYATLEEGSPVYGIINYYKRLTETTPSYKTYHHLIWIDLWIVVLKINWYSEKQYD
jgi:hypothetical protein